MAENYRILAGNALEILSKGRSNFVHCAITSPPYWGLRDYHSNPQVWDGEKDCEHEWQSDGSAGSFCVGCNAWQGQLGLEPDVEFYADHLVQISRGIRRVLRDDGTFWLNIGDTYATVNPIGNRTAMGKSGLNCFRGDYSPPVHKKDLMGRGNKRSIGNLKVKDLAAAPWRVALALQADGWWIRNAIVWYKPNVTPSSAKDRLTNSYEFIFLLTKSKDYYFDSEVMKEDAVVNPNSSQGDGRKKRHKRDMWSVNTGTCSWDFCSACSSLYEGDSRKRVIKEGRSSERTKTCPECGSKDDWIAHFAVFPPDLIEPCILAGCPEGGLVLDPFCGAGTTGIVSVRNSRRFVGIDIKEEYAALAKARVAKEQADGKRT